jgi:hypothetical protein
MPAQSAVAPAAAIFNIVISLVSHPGATHHKDHIHTNTGGRVDLDQVLPPQLVHPAFIFTSGSDALTRARVRYRLAISNNARNKFYWRRFYATGDLIRNMSFHI